MAAYGELHFEMFGFLCQASAVAVSSLMLKRQSLIISLRHRKPNAHETGSILTIQPTRDDPDPPSRSKGM